MNWTMRITTTCRYINISKHIATIILIANAIFKGVHSFHAVSVNKPFWNHLILNKEVGNASNGRSKLILNNIYDDWRSDAVADTMHLDEENINSCLDEFIHSDYGQQMFGIHEIPGKHFRIEIILSHYFSWFIFS